MKSSVRNDEVEDKNPIWERMNESNQVLVKDEEEDHNSILERMNEWNQVFVKMKEKIKIQSGIG